MSQPNASESTANFNAQLRDAAYSFRTMQAEAELRAKQARERPINLIGAAPSVVEQARTKNMGEASRYDAEAACYRRMVEAAAVGTLVIPGQLQSKDPSFLTRYSGLIAAATAANRLSYEP